MSALVLRALPRERRRSIWLLLAAPASAGLLIGALRTVPDQHRPAPAVQIAPTRQDGPSTAARSQDGAAEAAVALLTDYGSPVMYDDDARRALLQRTLSRRSSGDLEPQLDAGFRLAAQTLGLDGQGRSPDGVLVARAVPAGVHVLSCSPDRAVVSVWQTSLLGIAGPRSRVPVGEHWSTETVTLDWSADGWRWSGLQHAEGPTPVGSPQAPDEPTALAEAADRFVSPR